MRRAWFHRAWTWLVLQRVVVKVWHSQGPRRNSTKRSCLPWISTNGSLQLRERYHNTMTEASAKTCRCWTQAGWRFLNQRFWRPQGSPYRAYLAWIPCTVLPGISKIRPMAAAFIPTIEVLTTHHRWAPVVLIVAVKRKYCHSNATDGRNLQAMVS